MNCEEIKVEIITESGRPCSPEVQEHLAGCTACAKLRMEQQALWRQMDVWETPEISPSFDNRLFARLGQQAASPWAPLDWLLRMLHPLQPSFAAALACMLIMATLVIEKDRRAEPPMNSPAIHATEREDVRQIEMALEDVQMLSDFDGPSSVAPEQSRKTGGKS
jgi:hypothetical protein